MIRAKLKDLYADIYWLGVGVLVIETIVANMLIWGWLFFGWKFVLGSLVALAYSALKAVKTVGRQHGINVATIRASKVWMPQHPKPRAKLNDDEFTLPHVHTID